MRGGSVVNDKDLGGAVDLRGGLDGRLRSGEGGKDEGG